MCLGMVIYKSEPFERFLIYSDDSQERSEGVSTTPQTRTTASAILKLCHLYSAAIFSVFVVKPLAGSAESAESFLFKNMCLYGNLT